ncbi:hypothetical protein Bca52824_091377 [Brassica carinata]|uniref:Yippee domain-containing protein n=1 Tax=Brassica carinata TaxID=52824 RepID=A0A8X7TG58_BRACI|nr:hypothetical protein Bca52824_091377 [Brassica carinata]
MGENLIDLFGEVDHALKVFDRMAQSVGPRLYSCCNCRNHVGLHDDIISKAFQGRTGRAFLFSHAMNIVVGPKEDRNLLTGLHTVADISCADCNEPWAGSTSEPTRAHKSTRRASSYSKRLRLSRRRIGSESNMLNSLLD